jgi:hypothetical protein
MAQDQTQSLERFKGVFNQVFRTATSFGNPAQLLPSILTFGTELLFRFIRLGKMVRQKVEEQTGKLDTQVRAQGIFRNPISIELTVTEISTFFNGEIQILYPRTAAQFQEEIAILNNLDHPHWKENLRFLRIARTYIHHYMDNKELDEFPELQELIGVWQDPAGVRYHDLALQIAQLIPGDSFSLEEWRDLIPSYTKMMLQSERYKILTISEQNLAELNGQIRDISWQAITGGNNNTINLTLNFLVQERTLVINNQVNELNQKLKTLSAPPVDPVKIPEINQINTRVQQLNEAKKKISALASGAG